ncbi:MAG: hypothetical protein CBC48_07315 [bacterium TMED88]|nr:hypothetical protein [Deltaproteobacteria bacterium]OUV32999.1 MAG: hypothetical protein CBC48_07315 [bacterium TMED88]
MNSRSSRQMATTWWVVLLFLVSVLSASGAFAQSSEAEPVRVSADSDLPDQQGQDALDGEEEGAYPNSDLKDQTNSSVEEIVVRGSVGRTEEAPIAVSAMTFGATDLAEAQITDIAGLADYTPNLEINTGASTVANPTIFIRGIGLLDFNANATSSVAIFNDGVYQNSPIGQLFSFYDLEMVEVLRGPQGARHARNATAGAILVQPMRPDGTTNGYLRSRFGNYNLKEFEGALGFPIFEDQLSARISGKFSQRDGFTLNRCGLTPNDLTCVRIAGQIPWAGPIQEGLPTDVNNLDNWAARMILRYQPTDFQDWTLNINGGQSSGLAYQFQSRGSDQRGTVPGIFKDSLGYEDADFDPFAGDYDLVDDENLNLVNGVLRGTVLFDGFNLNWITGYSQAKLSAARNFDASPNQLAHVETSDSVYQASQKITLTGDRGMDFEWEVGATGLYEKLKTENTLLPGLIITQQQQSVVQEVGTWAVYADGSYFLTDHLRLSGGVRFNWEKKTFGLTIQEQPSPRNPGVIPRDSRNEVQSATWAAPTGQVILSWIPNENLEVYGRYTHGFKNGHFNGGAFFSAQLVDAVEPETVDSFEMGFKGRFLNGLLQLNAAAWYYDYKNYQVFALENSEGSLPLSQLLNAPRVESRGIEVDLTATPVEGMQFSLAMAVLDAKFTEFTVNREFVPPQCPEKPIQGFCNIVSETLDFSGNPLVAAPPVSVSALWLYDIFLGSWGLLTPRVDVAYRGKTYYAAGDETITNRGPNEGASQSPYFLVNLRLAYVPPNEIFELAFWVRNVGNQIYLANSLDVRDGLGSYLDVFGPPRTFGGTFTISW